MQFELITGATYAKPEVLLKSVAYKASVPQLNFFYCLFPNFYQVEKTHVLA